ncbi:MAG: TenA family transcriptional regulator [bacterium]
MSLNCETLIAKHPQAWKLATRHPFLNNCKTAAIQPGQFNTWLVQDYLFVTEFTRMAARLLATAPVRHFDTLLGGLAALKDELNWFRDKAAERRLELGVSRQAPCTRYCQFMEKLAPEPYPVQAVAFWAIELAYNQAWQLPGKMATPYDEFADRWGSPDFTAYVNLLAQQADEVLQEVRPEIAERAEQAFLEVCALEKDFWQMAFEGEALLNIP